MGVRCEGRRGARQSSLYCSPRLLSTHFPPPDPSPSQLWGLSTCCSLCQSALRMFQHSVQVVHLRNPCPCLPSLLPSRLDGAPWAPIVPGILGPCTPAASPCHRHVHAVSSQRTGALDLSRTWCLVASRAQAFRSRLKTEPRRQRWGGHGQGAGAAKDGGPMGDY